VNIYIRQMTISIQHKILFIHIPKNAGSSIRKALRDTDRFFSNFNHLSLEQYKEYLHPVFLELLFKFAVVRNPWDRAVSLYYYNQSEPFAVSDPERYAIIKEMNFQEFLEYSGKNLHQFNWMEVDGNLDSIDYIGRFEELGEVVKVIEDVSQTKIEFQHYNSTYHPPYQDMYNNYTRQIVAQKCEEDIDTFKYVFDPSGSRVLLL